MDNYRSSWIHSGGNYVNKELLNLIFKNIDSSSTTIRATASALSNRLFEPFEINPQLEPFAKIFSKFGASISIWLANSILKKMGIDRSLLKFVTVENAANWVISQYENTSSIKHDFIIIGAPSGAASHLASFISAPFLTQHFLLIVKEKERHPDDIWSRVHSGIRTANKLNEINNGNIEIIIHYDPAHDRFLLRFLDTVRFKLRILPNAYKNFILDRLNKEGTIIFLDVKYMWKHYRISDNSTFQVGGLGDITPDEYIYGSERLSTWLKSQGSSVRSWSLGDEYPIEEYPESEWGTINGLEAETRDFADENGFDFLKIQVNHPERLSENVFKFYVKFFEAHDIEVKKFFFDCFTAINPFFNLQTASIPIWLAFQCEDSYRFSKKMVNTILKMSLKENPIILFTLIPSYTKTLDQVPLEKWIELYKAATQNVILIGTSMKYYPFDILYPFNYMKDITKLSSELRRIIPRPETSYVIDLMKTIIS